MFKSRKGKEGSRLRSIFKLKPSKKSDKNLEEIKRMIEEIRKRYGVLDMMTVRTKLDSSHAESYFDPGTEEMSDFEGLGTLHAKTEGKQLQP